jgi:hypothetical protein
VLRISGGLVVDPAADQAHPGLGFAHGGFTRWSLQWIEIVATGVAPGSADRHRQGRVDWTLRSPRLSRTLVTAPVSTSRGLNAR